MSDKKEILKEIIEEASYRPVVPFFGAGVSISAGFPTIRFVIEYLAKVDFAIQFGVFEDRFPNIKEEDLLAVETYRRHPSKYLEDFGWPNLGQLNNDIWEWLGRRPPEDEKKEGASKEDERDKPKNGLGRDKILEKSGNTLESAITAYKKLLEEKPNENLAGKKIYPDILIYDVYLKEDEKTEEKIKDISEKIPKPSDKKEADQISNKTLDDGSKNLSSNSEQLLKPTTKKANQPLDFRDHQRAIVQWVLRSELFGREDGTNPAVLKSWLQWKHHYYSDNELCDELEPKLLYGDWEMLLDRLCEGNLNLVDTLFTSFENGLNPTLSHRFLSFLQPKLGIPLLLTTNFDSLLERAFRQEGIPPKVFDIHRDAELPNPALVHRQLSLLKLHGSAYGLRFGERLKYTLESDARNNALGYIPKDALMLVMGFNGSERRIMQMLQAFVQEREQGAVKPRLIWIQGPSEPGPLFYELLEKSNGGVKHLKVSHLDAFLQELYFHTTSNSYQSSAWGYSTVPNRPLTKGLKTFPSSTKEQKAEKRRPVQLFLADFSHKKEPPTINNMRSTSWASLAGMCFVNSLEGYTIIRIDLENHHTVEGIIAEFFKLVRVVDPQAPSCAISNMDDPDAAGTVIAKAVQRIFDVFKRGRYVLILDLVESFGRPQMVHHGMLSSNIPTENNKDHADQCRDATSDTNSTVKTETEEDRFIKQASNLKIFINELLRLDHKNDPLSPNRYWDSYVLVTADKPRHRHLVPSSKSASYDVIKTLVIDPLKKLIKDEYRHIYIYEQDQASSTTINKYANLIADEFLPDSGDPSQNLDEQWKQYDKSLPINSNKAEKRSLARSQNVLTLLDTFRLQEEEGKDDTSGRKAEKLSQPGTIEAFICLLSIFRRPRALPLLRSMIERWGLRQIGDFKSDAKNEIQNKDNNKSIVSEKDAMKTHQAIDELLQLIAISPQAKNKTASDKGCQETLEVVSQNNEERNDTTDKKDESQGSLGVVSQNHEGGIVWLFREVYEATYDALTENIHSNAWIAKWENEEKQCDTKELSCTAAIMDGTLSIIWHLFAARSYYVDVFLATHDMRAFWEYLYHRVSAIRVITLLITIIDKAAEGKDNKSIWDDINKHCKALRHQEDTEQIKYKNLPDNSLFEENHFVWYAWVLGIFDPIKQEQDVGENLEKLTNHGDLIKHFKILRKNSLNTLLMAIKKNKLLFRIEAAPDSVLAWSRQFIKSELNNMQEVRGYHYKKEGPETCIGDTVKELRQLFTRLKTQALCSKMDYKAILKDCCGLNLPDGYCLNDFKQRLEKKRNCFIFVIYFLKSNNLEEVVNGAINQAGSDSSKNITALLIEKLGLKSEDNKNDLNIALIETDKDKITEKLYKIIFDNAKKQLNDLFNIALCLVEPCDVRAEEYTGFILSQLKDIGRSNSDQVNNWVKKSLLRAYELSCRALFKEWTFWQPLLERGDTYSSEKNAEEKKTALLTAESHSVLYENLLRETTETNMEDVKHRSTALTIRARALYLRGHFPQAHHFIDLASAGLFPDRIEHWTLISVMHIVRAELLAISANEHYFSFSEHDQVKKKLIEQGFKKILDDLNKQKKPKIEAMELKDLPLRNFPEELQYFSTIAKILEPIAASSLKKIERAESELHHAEKLLRSMAHQSNWLIYMEFGLAQVQIEKMLFEMELLFLSRRPLTVTEYLKRSGKLEQKILDAMQRLRNILDIIPYDFRQLNDIDENERSAGRSMFKIEYNTFKLWRQLYVVGSFYSSLLNRLYGLEQSPKENPTIFTVTEGILEDCFSNTYVESINGKKYLEQWKLWCTAMRFERFGDDDNMGTFKFENLGKKNTLKYLSFGAMVIDIMGRECEKTKIEKMWCIRRLPI